jgi:hypothetical protein
VYLFGQTVVDIAIGNVEFPLLFRGPGERGDESNDFLFREDF